MSIQNKEIDIITSGLFAYILAGWKTLKDFVGPAVVTLMRDMGKNLYNYLVKLDILRNPWGIKDINDLRKYILHACEICGFPVSAIDIYVENKELTVKFFEDAKNCSFCSKLNTDETWKLLPLPMFSLLYFMFYLALSEKQNPCRFFYSYENNIWTYKLTFPKTIDLEKFNLIEVNMSE